MDDFERRGEPGGPRWLVASGLESRGVLAAFTERTGGASAPPFDSLNLGLKDDDDPGRVRVNRAAIRTALGTGPLAFAEQVHGAGLARVDTASAVRAGDGPEAPGCDALETSIEGVALAILTADCVPVALADDARVAAVHAGWRGMVAGVIERALEGFDDPARVTAAIGPAIGPCHYEVREDVLRAAPWEPSRVVRRRGSSFLDLPGAAADRLAHAGVTHIAAGAPCTACEPERFFSYRRDGRTGRQAMVVLRR